MHPLVAQALVAEHRAELFRQAAESRYGGALRARRASRRARLRRRCGILLVDVGLRWALGPAGARRTTDVAPHLAP